jgi:hypothetical protein
MEHIKSHRREASMQFMFRYINKMNKTCQVCQNKAVQRKYKITCIMKKHLGRAPKEFMHTFRF